MEDQAISISLILLGLYCRKVSVCDVGKPFISFNHLSLQVSE